VFFSAPLWIPLSLDWGKWLQEGLGTRAWIVVLTFWSVCWVVGHIGERFYDARLRRRFKPAATTAVLSVRPPDECCVQQGSEPLIERYRNR